MNKSTLEYVRLKRLKPPENVPCVLCKGKGTIEKRKYSPGDQELKERAIELLHKHGYGIRQIQRMLGYKSPRSIQQIVEKMLKKKS